jgi:hypothetical protein
MIQKIDFQFCKTFQYLLFINITDNAFEPIEEKKEMRLGIIIDLIK